MTLGDDYVQARDVGHNCLSEDGIIDASTCMLPENTWFIKNYGHAILITAKTAVTFMCGR